MKIRKFYALYSFIMIDPFFIKLERFIDWVEGKSLVHFELFK